MFDAVLVEEEVLERGSAVEIESHPPRRVPFAFPVIVPFLVSFLVVAALHVEQPAVPERVAHHDGVILHRQPGALLLRDPHRGVVRHRRRRVRAGGGGRRGHVRRGRGQPLAHEPRADVVRGGVEREPPHDALRELGERAD